MKRNIVFIIILLWSASMAVAQQNSTDSTPSLRRWELEIGGAMGHSLFRDMGASPLSYRGPAMAPSLSLCRYEDITMDKISGSCIWLTVDAQLGVYADAAHKPVPFNTDAAALRIGIAAGYDHLMPQHLTMSVCHRNYIVHHSIRPVVGLSLHEHALITTIPTLENSSTALSDMIYPSLRGGVQYEITSTASHIQDHRWTMKALVSLSPIGLGFRPGFSYMDNFSGSNGSIILNNFASSYAWDCVWMPVLATELGATYTMQSGNAIHMSYQWNYLTTRNSGAWRLDEASHMVKLSLNVVLKRKIKKQ